jgi:DNA-binding SARP family transcriptional activator
MNLFGRFALEYAGAPVTLTSQRMQALLAYLALHRAEPQSRQHLSFLLWPDSTESQAHTNLRTLLHRLNAVLPAPAQLIRADLQTVRWSPDCELSLDVDEFEADIRRATDATQSGDEASVVAHLERAIGCYSGELLPDCFDEWVLTERERLHQMLLAALEQLVLVFERIHHYAVAIPHARRLTLLDPLNEAAYQSLMRLFTLNGDRASALRVYHTCASTLQEELGIRPGSALNTAYERLLAAEAFSPGEAQVDSQLPLVGREQAWKRMQAAWQVVAAGQSRLLVLSGEAGVGKTRLAEELLRWAGRQGMITAAARCYAAEGDLAYTPVADLIRSDALRPGLAHLAAEWLSEIARVAPDLITTRPEVQRPDPMTERSQRQRLFEALTRAVLSADRPIMLLLDDLQWCDRDSLEWLHFLLRSRQHARLLVIGTMRVEEIVASHPMLELLEDLRREGRASEIALEPLNRDETVELAQHVAGHALSREHEDYIFAETEGNALFIVETMRANQNPVVYDAGHESDRSSSIRPAEKGLNLPPRVQATIAWRLKQLSAEALALLEVTAVIGRSFTFSVLARAASLDEDSLVRGLDELWQRRILREQGPDAYDFTHAKLRSVAYAGLSLARQRVLHRRVAQALEGEYATERDGISGHIAVHYERAGLVEQAVTYHRRAAINARQLYAHDIAIAHLQRALALLGDKPHPLKAGLYDLLGEIQHFIGHYEDARESWQRAIGQTPPSDRLTRANLYCRLGNAWRDQYHYDEALQAYDAADDALGPLTAEDNEALWSEWGQIRLEHLNVLYWLGHSVEMLHLIDMVQRNFQQRASRIQQARLRQMSAVALLRHNRYSLSPEAVEHARAYLCTMQDMGESGAVPAAHFQVGFSALWATEDLGAAEREFHTALDLAERSGDISLRGRCLTYLTVIHRLRSQVEEARTTARQSLEVALAGQMHDYIGAAHGSLAWAAWRVGDMDNARMHGQQALEAWRRLPAGYMFEWIGRWPLIGIALTEGNLSEALSQARPLLEASQKRMPESIEPALEAAIRAAEEGDLVASHTFLEQAAKAARDRSYL